MPTARTSSTVSGRPTLRGMDAPGIATAPRIAKIRSVEGNFASGVKGTLLAACMPVSN